jgi:hypothetical protein
MAEAVPNKVQQKKQNFDNMVTEVKVRVNERAEEFKARHVTEASRQEQQQLADTA